MNLRNWSIIEDYERVLQHRPDIAALRRKLIGRPEPIHALTRVDKLTTETIRLAHRIATNSDRPQPFRTKDVQVIDARFTNIEVIYTPPPAVDIRAHVRELIDQLLPATPVPLHIVLFHAAQLHAMFLCIHPFTDGNGRTARLLEKWYLSRHLGAWAWHIDTEGYYQANRDAYVRTLNGIGTSWDRLQWPRLVPFLQLLPAAIEAQCDT